MSQLLPTIQQSDMLIQIHLSKSGEPGTARKFLAVPSVHDPASWMLAMDSEGGQRVYLGKFRGGARLFKTADALIRNAMEIGINGIQFIVEKDVFDAIRNNALEPIYERHTDVQNSHIVHLRESADDVLSKAEASIRLANTIDEVIQVSKDACKQLKELFDQDVNLS